jgi:response regulator RpfG family c-di-GMP phosphodiesterase
VVPSIPLPVYYFRFSNKIKSNPPILIEENNQASSLDFETALIYDYENPILSCVITKKIPFQNDGEKSKPLREKGNDMFKNIYEFDQQDIQDHIILTAYIAEIKEWDNRSHLERIRRYTMLLASGLNLPNNEVRLFSTAAQLHDIGKITIPDSILKKTDNLEPHEYEIAERHTVEGAKLLRGTNSVILQAGEIIALTHHERWDGSGYPRGLADEEIPLSGRICALADVFDALTTKRPYKDEIQPLKALELIKDSSGSLFDPTLVKIFEEKFDDVLSIKRSVE